MDKFLQKNTNYLITTDNWFKAPDGESYRAIWGKAVITTAKDLFGFAPTRSTNWYAIIGTGDRAILIAGCQIHYAIRCDRKPKIKKGKIGDKGKEKLPTNDIYIP